MRSALDWPSLADELALSEALFGAQGPALIADWLDDELDRVTDPAFARSFADHIDLPGVTTEDYLQRVIDTQAGSLLAGIRFFGRDISRPFVEVIAHSFDDLDRLRDCVAHEWSTFEPQALRVRSRPGGLVSARNVGAAHDDLQTWHRTGHLHAVCTPSATVGLFAVAPGRIGWIVGHEICEEIIAVEHQGHGYAALGQAAGRRRVLDAVFVELGDCYPVDDRTGEIGSQRSAPGASAGTTGRFGVTGVSRS
jgi:hypothetical protein